MQALSAALVGVPGGKQPVDMSRRSFSFSVSFRSLPLSQKEKKERKWHFISQQKKENWALCVSPNPDICRRVAKTSSFLITSLHWPFFCLLPSLTASFSSCCSKVLLYLEAPCLIFPDFISVLVSGSHGFRSGLKQINGVTSL